MTIEINLDYLQKNQLSADQFVIIQLILDNRIDRLEEFKQIIIESKFDESIEKLIQLDYLEIIDETYTITDKCKKTFKNKGRFEEFYNAFPTSVIRPDGKRESLRTDKKRCATKYNRIAKRQDIHDTIMECLNKELLDRESNGTMKYMKKMPNWLSSEGWKEYENTDGVVAITGGGYGTEIIY